MKRKNILKFVSLLGIGSFVMLAAASCTTPVNPTPNPTPPSGGSVMSGGMNGENTNPGGGQGMMDSAAQELTAARTALTSLLASKNANVEMYSDYAKIKNDLTAAYITAETASQNQAGTLEQVKNATSTLQTAIDKADSEKQKFEQGHKDLLMPYSELKTTLSQKNATVMSLNQPKYSAILNKINSIYAQGEEVVTRTLDPVSGAIPTADSITKVNDEINKAISENQLKPKKIMLMLLPIISSLN